MELIGWIAMIIKFMLMAIIVVLFNSPSKSQSVDVFYDWLRNSARNDSLRACSLGRRWNQNGVSASNPQVLQSIQQAWVPRVGAAATMNYIAARARVMRELCPDVW